ncbi:MAG: hypothetical protein QM778_10055 [Myxococcales bacterium]
MRRRSWLLALLSLAALPAVGGCGTTPTLPLPPPVASVGQSVNGLVLVEGQVLPRAFVSVFNERTEAGVITRADMEGAFSAELEGEVGDVLTLWQEHEGDTGERKTLVVPAPR